MKRGPTALIAGGMLALILGLAALVWGNDTPPLVSLAREASPRPSSTAPEVGPSTAGTPASALPIASSSAPSIVVARISIPRIGIRNAPIYDRGTDRKGNMLIAPGYAVTHYSFSAPFGAGNAVIYGHDDINGNIFGRLYDLGSGDVIRITIGGTTQVYRVTGHQIVPPTDVAVMNPTADIRLTIITCWPFNVDTKRWIVTAVRS